MKSNIKRKKSGFTLAETLVALIILMLVTSIVALGVPSAARAYSSAVDGANAQVLLSTTVNALNNQLEFAKDISVDGTDNNTIEFISPYNGAKTKIFSDNKNGVQIEEYIGIEGGNLKRSLVSDKAATKNLYLKYDQAAYDDTSGLLTFTNIEVYKTGNDSNPIVSIPSFVIRVIYP